MLSKNCENCGKEFFKSVNCSRKNWNTSKFCSKNCSGFRIKHTPWNKGLKGIHLSSKSEFKKGFKHSEETKKKMRGNAPWNAGTAKIYRYTCTNCKKEFIVPTRSGSKPRTYCSPQCCYDHRKGKYSPSWKGGITSLYDLIRKNNVYKEWVQKILKRDKYTCKECNQVGGKLEVHHKKDFATIIRENKIKSFKDAIACKELWDYENAITLCKECHKETDNYCGRGIKRKK